MPCAARCHSALPPHYTPLAQILVSRLIDRPLRPMIAEGWTHDTQLLSWVLSYDQKTVPNPLSVCGCAAALAVSDIPLVKPVAAVQLGMHPDTLEFIVNPTREEFAVSPLNMMLAGTAEGYCPPPAPTHPP